MRVVRLLIAAILLVVGVSFPFTAAPAIAEADTQPVKVMPLGDSITWGTGSSDQTGYRGPLWDSLVTTGGYSVDFVGSLTNGTMADPDNEGHRGYRIDQIAASATGWLTTYRPDIVLLHIGTNDMNQDYQVSTAPARLGALIDQILAATPVTRVVVAQLVPSTDPTIQSRINAFNAAVPALVAARGSRVRLVDMSTLTAADMSDTLHPNDAGYKKMAARWYASMSDAVPSSFYREVTFKNSVTDLCATPYGAGITNGTQLTQWTCTGDPSQAWHRTRTPYGEWIVNDASGRCLAPYGDSSNNGADLVLSDCGYDSPPQSWNEKSTGTGYQYLEDVGTSKAVTPYGNSTSSGGNLTQWDYSGGTSQFWALSPSLMRLTAGDFNNDGKQDLIAINASTGHLWFYPGLGTGAFGTAADLGAGWGSMRLTAGDFNNDGKQDLIAINASTGHLWFYPGLGTGVFGTAADHGGGWGAMQFIPADFNGDGIQDLIAKDTATAHLLFYPGLGTGAFGAAADLGSGWGSMQLTPADFNDDGKQDLIAINASTGHLWFYPGLGTGSFGIAADHGGGWGSMRLTAGDFNDDGKQDLIAINASTGHLWFYPGLGTGSFGIAADHGGGWGTMQLIPADFNDDGKQDLIAKDTATAHLLFYPGLGTGAFGTAADLGSGW